MQIKQVSLMLMSLGACVLGLDLHSPEAHTCARQHWNEIRNLINPKIKMLLDIVPKDNLGNIKDLLDSSGQVSATPPSDAWLNHAADVIPSGMIESFGKDIINKCIQESK